MSTAIYSDDSGASCEDLPEVIMLGSTAQARKRSTSRDCVPITTDADAMFDEMFQKKEKKLLRNLRRTDSGCSVSSDSKTDTNRRRNIAGLMHLDSGISMQSVVSTESDDPQPSCSQRSRKKKTVAKKTSEVSKVTEREAKKQKLVAEKAARQADKEMNKVYKPGECMKYMIIEAHPSLLSAWPLADLQREVSATGAKLQPSSDLAHESLVLFSRRLPRTFVNDDGLTRLTEPIEHCTYALLIHTAEEISSHVLEHKLSEHVAELKTLAGCPLTLVVFGAKDYYSSKKQKKQADKRKFNELELEMSFTDLLVSADCDAVSIDKPIDLALLIVKITKALAEAPFKLARRAADEQAEFYMRGDNKNCVTIDKDGRGLSRLWQQMLAVLPHSGLEVARAVCAQHAGPLALFEALQEEGGLSALAGIGVARAAAPGARARKLGPELARKIATLLTADNGQQLLD